MPLTNQPQSPTIFGTGAYTAVAGAGDVSHLVATFTVTVSGRYLVFCLAGYGAGSPVAAEVNNMKLRKTPAGGSIADIAGATLTLPAALTVVPHTFVLDLQPSDVITAAVIAAGTSGVQYIVGFYGYRI